MKSAKPEIVIKTGMSQTSVISYHLKLDIHKFQNTLAKLCTQ